MIASVFLATALTGYFSTMNDNFNSDPSVPASKAMAEIEKAKSQMKKFYLIKFEPGHYS